MKKTLCLLLAFAFLVPLPACSSDGRGAPPPETQPVVETQPASETPPAPISESDNPLLRSGFFTDDVLSGSGKNIGTYGYTSIEKADLPDIGSEEFAKYLAEFADTKVQDSGYNWVSIIFDDGTGVCFAGSMSVFADYGNVDGEGCITNLIGTYIKSSDSYEYEENSIRSIPNPSLKQIGLVPDNAFSPAPAEIFTMTAKENGLGDTAFYADGEIVSRFNVGSYDTIQVATDAGDLYISAILVDFPEISEGDTVTVYFLYTGWSENLGGACGGYVYYDSDAKMETVNLPSANALAEPVFEEPVRESHAESFQSKIYVTKTGKHYHNDSNCNGGTYYESTLEEARRRGLTPCDKCVH